MDQRIAIVTGANRGLGLETSRQLAGLGYHVVLTGRRIRKVQAAVKELQAAGLTATEPALLDVTDETNVREFRKQVLKRFGTVHVLVNNAGQAFSDGFEDEGPGVMETRAGQILEAVDTNTLGAFRVTQAFWREMNEAGYGRVVNVSSGMGALSDMGGGWPAYRVSKTALNAITRVFAAQAGANVKVNSVSPGWARTDMGGSGATRSAAEGAASIVWAATLPDDGPSGGFFEDGLPVPW